MREPSYQSSVSDHHFKTVQHHPIVVPNMRDAFRHALPNVIEGKIVPIALFVGFLEFAGTMWALAIGLVYSFFTIAYRRATGRRVPGLVVLSTVALVARSVVAVATGSMLVYFLQPTISTVLIGLAFIASVPLGNPLAQKLACDVFPLDDETKAHPLVQQFFVRLSVLWALTSIVNALITVWLLFNQSATTFVLIKTALGPAIAFVTVGTAFAWFRLTLARSGTQLIWAPTRAARA